MEELLVRFRLVGPEAEAVKRLAIKEMRRPTDQVRYIIRRELERAGLLAFDEDVQGGLSACGLYDPGKRYSGGEPLAKLEDK